MGRPTISSVKPSTVRSVRRKFPDVVAMRLMKFQIALRRVPSIPSVWITTGDRPIRSENLGIPRILPPPLVRVALRHEGRKPRQAAGDPRPRQRADDADLRAAGTRLS